MRVLTFALALLVGGCFTYVPLPDGPPDPDPGASVLVELTEQGRERLQPITGSPERRARGTMLASSPDSLRFSVEFRGFSSSYDGTPLKRDVTIPRSEIAEVSLRRLSVSRTGILIGAGTIATFLILRAIGGTAGQDIPPPPPPAL